MAVIGVEHGVPGFVPDAGTGFWARRRASARAARDAKLAVEIEKVEFLKSSPVWEALIDLAPSLRGRPKYTISKPKAGEPVTGIVSSETRVYSFRSAKIVWSSIVAEVVNDEDGLSLKLNGKVVPKALQDEEVKGIVGSASDLPHTRTLDLPDHPMEYFRERLGIGRERIKLPKNR